MAWRRSEAEPEAPMIYIFSTMHHLDIPDRRIGRVYLQCELGDSLCVSSCVLRDNERIRNGGVGRERRLTD
jgi:hypothetical protein